MQKTWENICLETEQKFKVGRYTERFSISEFAAEMPSLWTSEPVMACRKEYGMYVEIKQLTYITPAVRKVEYSTHADIVEIKSKKVVPIIPNNFPPVESFSLQQMVDSFIQDQHTGNSSIKSSSQRDVISNDFKSLLFAYGKSIIWELKNSQTLPHSKHIALDHIPLQTARSLVIDLHTVCYKIYLKRNIEKNS